MRNGLPWSGTDVVTVITSWPTNPRCVPRFQRMVSAVHLGLLTTVRKAHGTPYCTPPAHTQAPGCVCLDVGFWASGDDSSSSEKTSAARSHATPPEWGTTMQNQLNPKSRPSQKPTLSQEAWRKLRESISRVDRQDQAKHIRDYFRALRRRYPQLRGVRR